MNPSYVQKVIQSLEKPTSNGYQWTVQPSEAGDLYHLISSEAGDFGIKTYQNMGNVPF